MRDYATDIIDFELMLEEAFETLAEAAGMFSEKGAYRPPELVQILRVLGTDLAPLKSKLLTAWLGGEVSSAWDEIKKRAEQAGRAS